MRTDILSRRLALDYLRQVIDKETTLNGMFAQMMVRSDLSDSDKGFVRTLTLETMRHAGQADFILSHVMAKPLAKKYAIIRDILRLGVVQLMWLNTPAHAAVDTSVELVRVVKKSSFTKLVNGVLRHIDRERTQYQNVPTIHNLPDWLCQKLEHAYGAEKTNRLADAFTQKPFVDITVKSDAQRWAAELSGTVLPTGSVRLPETGQIENLTGFKTGDWWVQNAAASIPAQLFSDLKGKTVADLCAAPGGKTAQLALVADKVYAFDISEKRLQRVHENINRLHLTNVNCQMADARDIQFPALFDAVLLDAPCSATGTIARHPEILFRLKQHDLNRLSDLQKQLMERAVSLTKPGGQIVFSTCSLLPEEGELFARQMLADYPNLHVAPVPTFLRQFSNKNGFIRTFPDDGYDGFFAVCFIKDI